MNDNIVGFVYPVDPDILDEMFAMVRRTPQSVSAEAARIATRIRDEAVDRIRRQWADERRVYLALAEDVRLASDFEDGEVDHSELWQRIERRLQAIDRFEAGEDPTEADTEDETRLPL